MKKTPIIVLSLLCALPALAESEQVTEVPRDAALIYQATETETDSNNNNPEKDVLISNALKKIQEKESDLDVEFKCKAVFYKWNYDSSVKCNEGTGWGPGGCFNPFNQVFGTSEFYTQRKLSVDVFCQPRSYDQKIVISLERRCEQTPTAECLDEKVKSAIQTIQPTVRYNLDKP